MNAIPKLTPGEGLTIAEFLAFTATRPQEERWELIEGVPVLNPSPIAAHQMAAANIVAFLLAHKRTSGATWTPLLGIGTRVPASPNSLPQPDVYVQAGPLPDGHITDDALVVFEVLSRANRKADQEWRRKVYASVPNCRHYVTVSLKRTKVLVFDRATGWAERAIRDPAGEVALDALGLALPLAEIYRYTPLLSR
ncbi:MAG: Uma2 family endonuclease [Hyphomicrobiaceae bacterium]|nr:Uma2 family endonuclease [Hyphomicrobiaceae bacterium]